jgi:hypothetical protein
MQLQSDVLLLGNDTADTKKSKYPSPTSHATLQFNQEDDNSGVWKEHRMIAKLPLHAAIQIPV